MRFIMAYYSRPTCCLIVGIIPISGPGDENIFYTTLCLSVCVTWEVVGLTGTSVC